ncbi:MATE family efflux transporter [Paenibacillus antarcticus]|uniref:Probable multidrug resistance protein NorM n=1 Tax=Paenibacillus antarcticus TaxID=253703 RepID=A0A168LNT5_9BACL|nr:MATE family efflux transporter [Paenibacillus antarcticus]OAB43647.1 MATE family efflux transporter [Paenibacillus antarcticus]
MKPTTTIREKYKQFLVILLPILITQITLSAITFFDTNMSGKSSSVDLAGVAIGSSLWIPVQVGLSGILMGLTPIVSQLIGNNQKNKVSYQVVQALWLSLILAVMVLILGGLVISPILDAMSLESNVRKIAHQFLLGISIGVIPLFGYMVLRSLIDALGETRTSMTITLMSLPINITLNYLLIFGKFGFPRLGGAGAGIASGITYWCIFFIAIWFVHRQQQFAVFGIFHKFYKISLKAWKELLKIGLPIGFSVFFETAVFAAVTLLMSQFNTATIAAHQAALNFATTLYMIPLSICMTLTILVGFEKGAGRTKDARQYALIGIGTAVALSLLTAVVLIFASRQVAFLYSDENHIIELIQHFLVYAIFFQISDAIATPTQGVLRGYKDVTPAFIIAFISFWVIGLPVGYLLATYTTLGADGYWIGLIAGLAIGAILLLRRLMYIQKRFKIVHDNLPQL